MAIGWFDPELLPKSWFDSELSKEAWFDGELIQAASSGGISGTASSSQAQTSASAGTVANPPVSGTASSSQAQTSSATGTRTIPARTGTASSSQAQTSSATGTRTIPARTGTASSSQAQTSSASGVRSLPVTGIASSAQAQTSVLLGDVPANGTQSGVSRLARSTLVDRNWLAAITAELNGMNKLPDEEAVQAKPIKQILAKFIEEADGSVTVLEDVQRAKTPAPIVTPAPRKIKRPQTVSWAYNIAIEMIQLNPIDVWAEERVLQVLQQAAQEAAEIEAEDELIIELAAQLMF